MTQATRNEDKYPRIRYLNWHSGYGRETVDEVRQCDFTDDKAWRKETGRLLAEYRMAGYGTIYSSARPCKNWK